MTTEAAIVHVIESELLQSAPGESLSSGHPEPVRWYWRSKGHWTVKRSDAHAFPDSSSALDQIRAIRETLSGIEVTLLPCERI